MKIPSLEEIRNNLLEDDYYKGVAADFGMYVVELDAEIILSIINAVHKTNQDFTRFDQAMKLLDGK